MKSETIAAFVVFTIGLAVATLLLPRYWRHEIRTLDRAQSGSALGDVTEAGLRIMPIAIAGGWLLVCGFMLLPLLPRERPESLLFVVPYTVALLTIVVLVFTVWFLNRPRFLVPPHLRDRPGTLSRGTRKRPGHR